MDRTELPYRKNCEGYFLLEDDLVIARDTGKGYIEFPGGGVEKGESPKEAVLREAFEEAGVKVKEVKSIGILHFDWDEDWAVTEKQKKRYQLFRGEEMHFFIGKVSEMQEASGDLKNDDPAWLNKRSMKIDKVISKLEGFKPFPQNMFEYRKKQLESMQKLQELLG